MPRHRNFTLNFETKVILFLLESHHFMILLYLNVILFDDLSYLIFLFTLLILKKLHQVIQVSH
jgi:hypothetical protein